VNGPKELHDVYRVNKGGAGSFDQVMRGLTCLKKHQVDFNILCTVHAANQHHPLQVYRFFRDELGAQFIQFIPIVERVSASMLPVANLGWSERPGGDRPLYTIEGNQVTERIRGGASVRKISYCRFRGMAENGRWQGLCPAF
jgi:uncharacterized protein